MPALALINVGGGLCTFLEIWAVVKNIQVKWHVLGVDRVLIASAVGPTLFWADDHYTAVVNTDVHTRAQA